MAMLVITRGYPDLYLVGGLQHFFSHILGMSSSQLTNSIIFFRGVGIIPPTRYNYSNYSPIGKIVVIEPTYNWAPWLYEISISILCIEHMFIIGTVNHQNTSKFAIYTMANC